MRTHVRQKLVIELFTTLTMARHLFIPPVPPPPLIPDTVDENGFIDSNWFKIVITKCSSGQHAGTASVSLDRSCGLWTELPESFITSVSLATSMVPIKDLILRNHRLTKLPHCMISTESELTTSLVVLDISSNCFEVFPSLICNLQQLRKLYASNNKIQSLPAEISSVVNLEILYLNNNLLDSFSAHICQLKLLVIISMENNNIELVPEDIGNMTSLCELYLKSNKITELPHSIGELKQLETLHIADNKLVMVPDTLGNMCKLRQLHLAKNNLTELPSSLVGLKNLQGITIGNNPLVHPPQTVCRKGVEAIFDYLKLNRES